MTLTAADPAATAADRGTSPTVPAGFLKTVERVPGQLALRSGTPGEWQDWSYQAYAGEVARLAAGLLSLGVQPGDRLLLLVGNRPAFHFLDLAAQCVRAVPVSVYGTSSAEEIAFYAEHSGAVLAFGEDDAAVQRLDAATAGTAVRAVLPVADGHLAGAGQRVWSAAPADLDRLVAAVRPADVATMIYSSGTTGRPKAVPLTQANVVFMVDSLVRSDEPTDYTGWRRVSYLPTAHVAERLSSQYSAALQGCAVVCCPDPTQLVTYLAAVRPHTFFGVPRVWEKLQAGLQQVSGSTRASDCRAALGLLGLDEVRRAYTGSAPIPVEVVAWFAELGLVVADIYGLSETTALVTAQHGDARPGTVGRALPGVELRIEADGEILTRGPHVFPGYWDDAAATAATVVDGWLHTGDLGELDQDGYLRISGRKKELIVTSGGKNISPAALESGLRTLPLVGFAVAIGDARPYVVALLVPEPDAVRGWAGATGLGDLPHAELCAHPLLHDELQQGVDAFNASVSRPQQVKRFAVVPDVWLPGSDVVTPTMKVRRGAVHERYRVLVDSLYA